MKRRIRNKKSIHTIKILVVLVLTGFTVNTVSTESDADFGIKLLDDKSLTFYIKSTIGKLNTSIHSYPGSMNETDFRFNTIKYDIWNPYNSTLNLYNFTLKSYGYYNLDNALSFTSQSTSFGHACPSIACPFDSILDLQPGINTFNNTSETIDFQFQNKTNSIDYLPKGVYHFGINVEGADNLRNISYDYENIRYRNEFNVSLKQYTPNITSDGMTFHIQSETLNNNWGKVLYSIQPIIETKHQTSSNFDSMIPLVILLALEGIFAFSYYFYRKYKP